MTLHAVLIAPNHALWCREFRFYNGMENHSAPLQSPQNSSFPFIYPTPQFSLSRLIISFATAAGAKNRLISPAHTHTWAQTQVANWEEAWEPPLRDFHVADSTFSGRRKSEWSKKSPVSLIMDRRCAKAEKIAGQPTEKMNLFALLKEKESFFSSKINVAAGSKVRCKVAHTWQNAVHAMQIPRASFSLASAILLTIKKLPRIAAWKHRSDCIVTAQI